MLAPAYRNGFDERKPQGRDLSEKKTPLRTKYGAQRRGAGDRARTGTLFPARDFKSLASANSTTPANQLIYFITKSAHRQGKGRR